MDAIVYDKVGKEAEKVREALYGIYPQETITDAAIASFDDGADGIPVKALTVEIEPVQDLHGYDHPWPAGGNKNICPPISLPVTSGTVLVDFGRDITFNGVAISFVLSGSFSAIGGSFIQLQTEDGTPVVSPGIGTFKEVDTGNFLTANTQYTNKRVYFGESASAQKTFRKIVLYNYPSFASGSTVSNAQIEEGSTVTDYVPYENICPISGWTGAEVQQTGKNAWDEQWEVGGITSDTGRNQVSTNRIRSKNFIPVKPGSQICLNMPWANIFAYDKDKSFIVYGQSNNRAPLYIPNCTDDANVHARVWTVPNDVYFIRFTTTTYYGVTYKNDISLNYPATDTTYHAYTGSNQISVTFPSEAGTVYGGEDKVTTGKLKKTMGMVDLGTLEWTMQEGSAGQNIRFYTSALSAIAKKPAASELIGLISSVFVEDTDPVFSRTKDNVMYLAGNGNLYIEATQYATAADFKNAMAGQTLVYPLAEPVEFDLTPQEMTTLYGVNNVWADTGNIEKLTYRADLGKYIDSHITTAVANALNA